MTSALPLDPPAGVQPANCRGGGQFWIPSRNRGRRVPAGMSHERQADCARGGENGDYGRYWVTLQYPRQTSPLTRSMLRISHPLPALRGEGRGEGPSHFLRLLHDPHDAPGLRLRELARGLDLDQVARLALVRLVVRVVLVRLDDDLVVDRVLDAPLDEHGHRLVHLVAGDATGDRLDQRLARRRFRRRCSRLLAHLYLPFACEAAFVARPLCASSVRTRAMPRRTSRNFAVFVNCCVARCIRKPNCSLRSASSSPCSSVASFCASARLRSFCFIVSSP